jgi:hypothetical protein
MATSGQTQPGLARIVVVKLCPPIAWSVWSDSGIWDGAARLVFFFFWGGWGGFLLSFCPFPHHHDERWTPLSEYLSSHRRVSRSVCIGVNVSAEPHSFSSQGLKPSS